MGRIPYTVFLLNGAADNEILAAELNFLKIVYFRSMIIL
jgi:hypothetical protein